jgi:hypothetical protein
MVATTRFSPQFVFPRAASRLNRNDAQLLSSSQPHAAPAEEGTKAKAAPSVPQPPAAGANAHGPKKWTFLFYINGNNALSKQAPSLLRQLEFVGTDPNINLVAQVARQKGGLDKWTHDWSGVRRYEVPYRDAPLDQNALAGEIFRTLVPPYTRGITSKCVDQLGNADMGSPQTFSDFVKWGINNYPAENVCVVMLGPSQGMKGVMGDDTSGHQISPGQLKDALADVEASTGKKVAVLAFDASNATQAEMLYELKDHVNYVVGSEGLVSGAGMSVPSVLYELKQSNKDLARTPEEVAQTFTMVGSMAVNSAQFTPTLSAIDMSKMDNVKASLNDLANALLTAKVDPKKLRAIIKNTQEVAMPSVTRAYEGVKDAGHFAKLIAGSDINDPGVKAAAQHVMDSIDDALVGEAHRGGPYRDATGISVFLPDNYGYIRPDSSPVPKDWDHKFNYENLQFAKDSAWAQLLTHVSKDSLLDRLATRALGTARVDSFTGWKRGMEPTVQSWSNLASTVGWWESFNAMSVGARPGSVLFIPGNVACYAGAYGGVWDSFQGLKAGVSEFKQDKSFDGIVMNGLDILGGAAKTVACLSLLHPGGLPLGYAAGMFGFVKPWIKDAYGYFIQYKQIRDSIALGGDREATSKAAVLAAQRVVGKNQIWT